MTSTDSTTTDGGVAPSEIESRVVKKVARRLIPFLILLYFVNYLDRTNIAFAKLTMSADLGMTETMFGLASGLFFVGYLLFEVPSNLALHRFGAGCGSRGSCSPGASSPLRWHSCPTWAASISSAFCWESPRPASSPEFFST